MQRYAILAVGVLAALLFVRLGLWQLDRRGQRLARNAAIAARLAQPPVAPGALNAGAPIAAADADSLAYRRATVGGAFDFAHQLVVVARSVNGVPGVSVVTPLRLSGDEAILVERGWVASADARTVDLAALREPDTATVTGVLLRQIAVRPTAADSSWPRYVRVPDPRHVAADYPAPLVPLVLRRTVLPAGSPAGLRPVPLPELSGGPHLSYAIQWFAFAVIAVVGSVALYRKSRADDTGVGG